MAIPNAPRIVRLLFPKSLSRKSLFRLVPRFFPLIVVLHSSKTTVSIVSYQDINLIGGVKLCYHSLMIGMPLCPAEKSPTGGFDIEMMFSLIFPVLPKK